MTGNEPTRVAGFGLTIPPGTRLNGIFEIEKQIGAGGMGMVYRAHNVETGDPIAIKIVRAEMADNAQVIALFRKEAAVLNQLYHDAIVRYYLFTSDPGIGRPYLATEFVEGTALSDITADGPLARNEVLSLAERLADGLRAAHALAIFHRDISPDNVILPARDVKRAKIIDFGIARAAAIGGGTVIGDSIAGKFDYMSPEQLGLYGGSVDARSDIYSLGIVLAEAMLGRGLNMGGTQLEVVEKRRKVPDLSAIEPGLRGLLTAMTQPKPQDRIQSMGAVVERAHALRTGIGTKGGAKPWAKIAAGVAVAALVAGGGAFYLTEGDGDIPPDAETGPPPLLRQAETAEPARAAPPAIVAATAPAADDAGDTAAAAIAPDAATGTAPGPAPADIAAPQESAPSEAQDPAPPPVDIAAVAADERANDPPEPQPAPPETDAAGLSGAGSTDTAEDPAPLPDDGTADGAAIIVPQQVEDDAPLPDQPAPSDVAGEREAPSSQPAMADPDPGGGATGLATADMPGAAQDAPAGDAAAPPPPPTAEAAPGTGTEAATDGAPSSPPEPSEFEMAAAPPDAAQAAEEAAAPGADTDGVDLAAIDPGSAFAPSGEPQDSILRYIRQSTLGPCTHIRLVRYDARSALVDAFGDSVPPFEEFDRNFKESNGFEAQINLQLISPSQCPLVDLADAVAPRDEGELRFQLDKDIIKPGEVLSGAVTGLDGRDLRIYLVASDGRLYALDDLVTRGKDDAALHTVMSGTSGSNPGHLLLALAGEALPTLKLDPAGNAATGIAALRAGLTESTKVEAVLRYFKYGE